MTHISTALQAFNGGGRPVYYCRSISPKENETTASDLFELYELCTPLYCVHVYSNHNLNMKYINTYFKFRYFQLQLFSSKIVYIKFFFSMKNFKDGRIWNRGLWTRLLTWEKVLTWIFFLLFRFSQFKLLTQTQQHPGIRELWLKLTLLNPENSSYQYVKTQWVKWLLSSTI